MLEKFTFIVSLILSILTVQVGLLFRTDRSTKLYGTLLTGIALLCGIASILAILLN